MPLSLHGWPFVIHMEDGMKKLSLTVAIAGVALLAVRLDAPAALDLVLVATLVGFLSTVAFARLVASRSSS